MQEDDKIINEPCFFSLPELRILKDLESQQVKKVLFHYWINSAKTNDIIQLLNYIEFQFIDNTRLFIAASELCDCIRIIDVDIETERKMLSEKFNGLISLQSTDQSNDPLWSRMIGYPVAEVILDKNISNQYYSDKLIIDFCRCVS